MTVLVWSERNDPAGGEHDCAYSSILMVLVHGGKVSYPLGIYTVAEREALERSDTRADEEGASPSDIDLAIATRYGLKAHAPAVGTALRSVLTTPGLAVSVGGQLSNLPYGHPLRRYAPNYTGGHRICFLTSTRTWLDPLAPWKYAGDVTSVDNVVTFAQKRAVTDLRYLKANELATTGGIAGGTDTMGLRLRVPSPAVAGTISVAKGTPAQRASDGQSHDLDGDATGRAAYAVQVVNDDGSVHATGYLLDLTRFGLVEAWFVDRRDIPATAFKPGA
jgi:hypothetical protein